MEEGYATFNITAEGNFKEWGVYVRYINDDIRAVEEPMESESNTLNAIGIFSIFSSVIGIFYGMFRLKAEDSFSRQKKSEEKEAIRNSLQKLKRSAKRQ